MKIFEGLKIRVMLAWQKSSKKKYKFFNLYILKVIHF